MTRFISEQWNKLETWQKVLTIVLLVILAPTIIAILWQTLKFLVFIIMIILVLAVIVFGGAAVFDDGDFGGFE